MISANKVFGSYVLQDVNLLDIAPDHHHNLATSEVFVTKCAIPSDWISLELIGIKKYNHDTSILKFSLPSGRRRLDLPVGSFLLVKAPRSERDGKDAIRPYTSISDDDAFCDADLRSTGTFEILCKRYDEWGAKENKQTHFLFTKTDHSYKPPGAASNYIHKLTVGSTLEFRYSSECVGRNSFPFLEEHSAGARRQTLSTPSD
jgi:Oxidoreductase FAD-binding domain